MTSSSSNSQVFNCHIDDLTNCWSVGLEPLWASLALDCGIVIMGSAHAKVLRESE